MANHTGKIKFLAFVMALFLLLWTVPSFVNLNAKKHVVEANLQKFTGVQFKINGDMKFQLLPLPAINMKNVVAQVNEKSFLPIHEIDIYPNVISLFSDEIKINKIGIHQSNFEYEQLQIFVENLGEKFPNYTSLPNLEFQNTNISNIPNGLYDSVEDMNAFLSFNTVNSNKISLNSSFTYGGEPYEINSNINIGDSSKNSSNVQIFSSGAQLSFSGSIIDVFNKAKLDGELEFAMKPSNDDSDSLSKNFSIDGLKISADLKVTDSVIKIGEFKIQSKSIRNASGQLEWIYGEDSELTANVAIESFDLDGLLANEIISEGGKYKNVDSLLETFIRPMMNNFDTSLRSNLFGGMKFSISEVTYNGQKIKNILSDVDIYNGNLFLNKFDFEAPGKTKFHLAGNISFNEIRPKFDGEATLNIDSTNDFAKWLKVMENDSAYEDLAFKFASKVTLIPNNLRLNEIDFKYGPKQISGKIELRDTGAELIKTKMMLKVNELNADQFNIPGKIDDIISSLYLNDDDKDGKKLLIYFDNYRWLRTFPYDVSAEILADKVVYKNKEIKKAYSAFKISPNKIDIQELRINSDLINVIAGYKFDLASINPNFDLSLNIRSIDWHKFRSLFPSEESLLALKKERIKNESNISNGDDNDEMKSSQKNAPKQYEYLNFYSLHNYEGNFDISVAKIENAPLPAKSYNIKGNIGNGIVNFEKCDMDLFKGEFNSKGRIIFGVSIPNFSFSYALNNFDPRYLLYYAMDINNMSGFMSLNGTIESSGLTYMQMLENMTGSLSFIGKKIEFIGFDIGKIIRAVESQDPINIKIENVKFGTRSGTSIFDDVTGKLIFNKGIIELRDVSFENNRATGALSSQADYINKIISTRGILAFMPAGTFSKLTIDFNAKGKTENIDLNFDTGVIEKYLRLRMGPADQEKKDQNSPSLLRNRKL